MTTNISLPCGLFQFWWEKHTQEWGYGAWTNYFPKILMAFTIGLMENIYKKVAVWLNEFGT